MPPINRKHLCLVLACAITVIICLWHVVDLCPWNRLGGELYAAYHKSTLTGSIWPLIIMDACPTADFSMPYCGWPPLYGILLYPFAIVGLPYFLAGAILNGLILVASGFVWAKVVSKINPSVPIEISLPAATLSTAFASNLAVIFPHFLIPLSFGVASYGALACLDNEFKSKTRLVMFAIATAVSCGLSNWASYFSLAFPSILFVGIFVMDWSKTKSFKASVHVDLLRFIAIQFIVFVIMFLLLKWLNWFAFEADDAVLFRSGMAGHQLEEKLRPTPNGLMQAGFYTFIRAGVALLPILAICALRQCHALGRRCKSQAVPPQSTAAMGACNRMQSLVSGHAEAMRPGIIKYLKIAGLWLAPLSFCIIFSGEQSISENAFHSMLWLGPATGLLALSNWKGYTDNQKVTIPVLLMVLFTCTAFGHYLLPKSFKTLSRNLPTASQLIRSAGSIGDKYSPKLNLEILVTTALRQVIPLTRNERYDGWKGVNPSEIVKFAESRVPQHSILTGFNLYTWAYSLYASMPLVYLEESAAPVTLQKLIDLGFLDKTYVLVPEGGREATAQWLRANGFPQSFKFLEVPIIK